MNILKKFLPEIKISKKEIKDEDRIASMGSNHDRTHPWKIGKPPPIAVCSWCKQLIDDLEVDDYIRIYRLSILDPWTYHHKCYIDFVGEDFVPCGFEDNVCTLCNKNVLAGENHLTILATKPNYGKEVSGKSIMHFICFEEAGGIGGLL